MDQDDPADWSVDRAIQEVCYNQSPTWAFATGFKPVINPDDVAKAFKDNDIDGDNLLALRDEDIRVDLGIASFGQRRRLLNIISCLRQQSSKYEPRTIEPSVPSWATPHLSHTSATSYMRSPSLAGLGIQPSIENIQGDIKPTADSSNIGFGLQASSTARKRQYEEVDKQESTPNKESPNDASHGPQNMVGEWMLQSNDPVRAHTDRRVFNAPTDIGPQSTGELQSTLLNTLDSVIDQELDAEPQVNNNDVAPTISVDDLSSTNPTKRKNTQRRANLIPVTDRVEIQGLLGGASLWQPAVQDAATENDSATEHSGNRTQPTAKRQKLTHHSANTHYRKQLSPSLPDSNASRRRQVRADQLLRTDQDKNIVNVTGPGSESGASSFLIMGSGTKSRSMKHAARSVKSMSELRGYVSVDVNKQHDIATDMDHTQVNATSALPTSNFHLDLDPHLQQLLDKYPSKFYNDEYPPYGESDEEDRWTSVSEEEEESLPVTVAENVPSDVLTVEEVNRVIDECLEAFKAEWNAKHLIKTQVKAHKKWMTAAKNKIFHRSMLENYRTLRAKHLKRIEALRNGIHVNQWRKPKDIRVVCQAIETTVHECEEWSLYINVLACEKEPHRPLQATTPRVHKPRKHTVLANGDEELDSDSDDSFVVADDLADLDNALDCEKSDNSTWNPQFAEKSTALAQQTLAEMEHSPHGQDAVIDSIEDNYAPIDSAHTPQDCISQNGDETITDDSMDIDPEVAMSSLRLQEKSNEKQVAVESVTRNRLELPDLTESESESDNSDFDREPQIPPIQYRKSGKSKDEPIDLTRQSPSSSQAVRHGSVVSVLTINTPRLKSIDPPALRSPSEIQENMVKSSNTIFQKGRSSGNSRTSSLLKDVARVQDMDWDDIEPLDGDPPDSYLALAKTVYSMAIGHARRLLDYIQSFRKIDDLHDVLQNGLAAAKEYEDEIDDVDQKNQARAQQLTDLLISYATGLCIDSEFDYGEKVIDEAHTVCREGLGTFRQRVELLLRVFIEYSENRPASSRRVTGDPSSGEEADLETKEGLKHKSLSKSKSGKRKNIVRDKDVLEQQRLDRYRVKRQERKRDLLLKQQAGLGLHEGQKSVFINVNEPIVYLHPKLAVKVKPHQIEGIRFMWREVVENPSGQGCLLAHTMGLGKTMQVISLLASIALCNQSTNVAMQNHIPKHLQSPRVLILCPMTLIENWFEELTTWLPDTMMLGVIIKLDNHIRQPETTIRGWYKRGGVLITSYDRFRNYVLPVRTVMLEDHLLQARKRHLTEGPDIVIADEAHRIKNAQSKLSQATSLIQTKSRIAMTGSPLNNYLEEYHSMIQWIAPGYLGNMAQFRARYSEPINRGLYAESTAYERKASMKRLHMLKRTIAPKIHRADITAISKDLPPKVEFFLTITLTKEQKQAYEIFVEDLRSTPPNNETKGKLNNTRVWSWLNILSLLLNHPSCFIEKLKKREQLEHSSTLHTSRAESEDEGYDSAVAAVSADNTVVAQQPELANAMSKVMDVFSRVSSPLSMEDPNLSHKSLLIKLIVEEAIKLNEKTLIFSKSIPTLDYYEKMIQQMPVGYKRIDGQKNSTTGSRQKEVADFSASDLYKVFLISTKAGGLGLNIQSANRVIISDFDFNPTWEEQAVGRAYRIGQTKPVFVYRFLMGGTFEELVHNKAVFKTQLFTRVVDERNVMAQAAKKPGEFLFDPKEVEQKDFSECLGKDPNVLDRVLQKVDCVRDIFLTETFYQDTDEQLDEQEIKEADELLEMERLEREDPDEYARRLREKQMQNDSTALANLNIQRNQLLQSVPTIATGEQRVSHFVNMEVPAHLPVVPTLPSSISTPLHGYFPHRVADGTGYGDEYVTPSRPQNQFWQTKGQTRDDHALPTPLPQSMFTGWRSTGLGQSPQTNSPYFTHAASNTLTYKNLTSRDFDVRPPEPNTTSSFVTGSTENPFLTSEVTTNEVTQQETTEDEISNDKPEAASGCRPQ